MTVRKLKKERKTALKKTRAQKVKDSKRFQQIAETIETQYAAGVPVYAYQIKRGEVKDHLLYWQTHPKYSQIISFVDTEDYTKTNVTIKVCFR